jgi:hypothetical protein
MQRYAAWLVAWWLVVGMWAPAAAGALPASPFEFAVFGLEGVELGQRVRVTGGDVGANVGRVELGRAARVPGTIAGDTIRLAPNVRTGGLRCVVLERTNGKSCGAVILPLVDGTTLPIVQVISGAEDVRLPARSERNALPAGKYRRIRIGTKSRLTLAGGAYGLRALVLNKGAQLVCETPCTIDVEDGVTVGRDARLSAAAPLDATAVRVNVDFAGRSRAAFKALARSTVDATVYAPDGIIRLGTNGRFTGAFVGRAVEIRQRAVVTSRPGA